MPKNEESSALDDCQHADRVTLRMEDDFQKRKNERGRDAYAPLWVPAPPKTFLSWMELRSHAGGAVEVAFDHDNSDIIMETYVAAEVCRAVKDIDREPFCRE